MGRLRQAARWRAVVAAIALALLAVACSDAPAEEGASPSSAVGSAASEGGGGPSEGGEPSDAGAATGDGQAALEGETVDFVVPYEPGGGYDTYARLIAPFLAECTGATVVVQNEPGAGGLLATTQTFVAPAEQMRIQIINTVGAVSAQIAGAEGAQFQLAEFNWLGRISSEPNVMVVADGSDIAGFDDVLGAQDPIRFVTTGPGSNEYVNSAILPEVYGFPSEIITGFAGSGEARAAVLAGDADAHILPLDSQIDAIDSGDVRPVLVIAREPSETLPDTPTVSDFTPDAEEQQAIIDSLVSLVETGRSVAASPEMPEDAVAALGDGLACALANQELVDQAEQQQRSISPLTGEEMAGLVQETLDSPEAFQQLVTEAS